MALSIAEALPPLGAIPRRCKGLVSSQITIYGDYTRGIVQCTVGVGVNSALLGLGLTVRYRSPWIEHEVRL